MKLPKLNPPNIAPKQMQEFSEPGLTKLPQDNPIALQDILKYTYLLKTGSDQTIASGGSGATIAFATNENNDKRTVATANTITIKKPGQYIVSWVVNIDATNTGEVTLDLENGGSTTLDTLGTKIKQVKELNPAGEYTLAGSVPLNLADGSTLTLNITHNTGAGFVVKAGAETTFRVYGIV